MMMVTMMVILIVVWQNPNTLTHFMPMFFLGRNHEIHIGGAQAKLMIPYDWSSYTKVR